jgi:hypothetical protein
MEPQDSLPCSQQPATGTYPYQFKTNATLTHNFYKTHLIITLTSTQSGSSPQVFRLTSWMRFSSLMRAACPLHLIFLHFITLTVFNEKYDLWSFSLRNFVRSLIIHSQVITIIIVGPSSLLSNGYEGLFPWG